MARIRSIKPEFFLNDALAELPPITRLLFVGLWTQADREGRMEYRPKRLKAALLPYDECDIDEQVSQLETAGFIAIYTVGDSRYLEVLNFLRHQVPNAKERASTIPAHDEHSTRDVLAPCKHSTGTPLIGREGKGREGKEADAREETPPIKANLPACLRADDWAIDDGPFQTSSAHILQAIERKHGLVSTADIGRVGEAMRSVCPKGCTGNASDKCAADFIDKIARANTLKTACDFYVKDRRTV